MARSELDDARREAHLDATLFCSIAVVLLLVLGVSSLVRGWDLVEVGGWIWFVLAVPEVALVGSFLAGAPRRAQLVFLGFVVAANVFGLVLLVSSLVTEKSKELTGGQLLLSGFVVWLTNVIVFGLLFWTVDAGGPVARALHGRRPPDFAFPQDQNPELARRGWYPRLEDYVYVALTNGIAFSPTDAMPMTRRAKALMATGAVISVAAVLLVAARAVNVLG